jgi:4-amino-4-deoxy-L-arabinose transferase-like glycosyltransferase
LFAGSSWLLSRLADRAFGAWAAVMAVLALNSTVFFGLMIGTCAEPDGPLLFFWLLTLDRLLAAFDRPGKTWPWIAVGLCWGSALLSKYHAVLLPAGAALYLLLNKPARRCLTTPGPYLAGLTGMACFAPVIYWNASHQWASFAFQSNRAGGFHGFQPAMLVEALTAQVLFLTPWVWFAALAAFVNTLRRGMRAWSDTETFLISQALPAIGLFMGIATYRRIMPHWPLIGFVALMPMVGKAWADRLSANPGSMRKRLAFVASVPAVLVAVVFAQAKLGIFQDSRGRMFGLVSAEKDPTVDLVRWDEIGRELKRRGLLDDPKVFLMTDSWRYSSQLAMGTDSALPVACYELDSRSYSFWSKPDDWVGRSALFVRTIEASATPEHFAPYFSKIERLEPIAIVRGGRQMQTVELYRCIHQTDAYHFGHGIYGPIEPPHHGEAPAMIGQAEPSKMAR